MVVWHRRGPGPRLQKDSQAQKSVCVGGCLASEAPEGQGALAPLWEVGTGPPFESPIS